MCRAQEWAHVRSRPWQPFPVSVQSQHILTGEAAILQAGEDAESLLADGIGVERANTPVSSVMKGDGQVITKLGAINHQLRGFVQPLDTPADMLSAADVAMGALCGFQMNLHPRGRMNWLLPCVPQTGEPIKRKASISFPWCAWVLLQPPLQTPSPLWSCSAMGHLGPRWGNGMGFVPPSLQGTPCSALKPIPWLWDFAASYGNEPQTGEEVEQSPSEVSGL